MPYTKKFKKDRRYLLNAINFPTPYQQCKDAGYRAFSTKNNRKQMDTVCSVFPVSGHIDLTDRTDSSIKSMTTSRCDEYRLGGNRNKCEQQVMNIIHDDMIRYRDEAKVAAAQIAEEKRIAENNAELGAAAAAAEQEIRLIEAAAEAEAAAALAAAAAASGDSNDATTAENQASKVYSSNGASVTSKAGFGGIDSKAIGILAAVGIIGWLGYTAMKKGKKKKRK